MPFKKEPSKAQAARRLREADERASALVASSATADGGGSLRNKRPMVVLLLFALLVRSAASAPGFRSGFRSGLGCASFGRWARPCVRGATRAGSAASRRRWW